ncbi:MAG: sulfotransferase family protein [Acidimicrobiales bacterium]
MSIKVVGAGVGRTGTHSLKVALERLVGGTCHHMIEVFVDPEQIASWTAAMEGRPVDWQALLARFDAIVDWPGASFWPELHAAFPEALVLLSVRDPEAWYRSASNTIFLVFDNVPPEMAPWMDALRRGLGERFSNRFDDPQAMMDAFERHNDAVRRGVPASQLLEWQPQDGWEPICERLGVPVPDDPFPLTNTTADMRAMLGLPPLEPTG